MAQAVREVRKSNGRVWRHKCPRRASLNTLSSVVSGALISWLQHLNPDICNYKWTPSDSCLLLELQTRYGTQWKQIAEFFLGRTDNQIKNQFFSIIRKILRQASKVLEMRSITLKVNTIKPKEIAEVMNHPVNSSDGKGDETIKEYLCRFFLIPLQPYQWKTKVVDKAQLARCMKYLLDLK